MSGGIQTVDTSMAALPTRDGRHRRTERTREACLAACRYMMMGGVFQPTVANVASRAGVSVRTVFDHFDTVENLRRVAIDEDGTTRAVILRQILGPTWQTLVDSDTGDLIVRAVVRGKA